jgi:ferritin-like metal-binding protein YciE
MKSMNDLMLHFLQDIYDAEKRGLRGMQKMARAAAAEELKEAILQHRDQSQQQISRLERVFEMVGKRPRGRPCAAMEGLADEVDEAIEEGEKGPVLDAALIANAQAVEHYEIARYGTMAAWAKQVGMAEAAQLLEQTLQEEKQSDQRLNDIALRSANPEAGQSGAEDEEAGEEEKPVRRRRVAAAPRKAESKPAPAPRGTAKKPPGRRGAARK